MPLPALPPADVASVFFIAKSENKNEVHYGVRVDDRCAPLGERPVHAYWRMKARGEGVVEPLLPREEGVYGVGRQYVTERREGGGTVTFALRALPGRTLVLRTFRDEAGTCRAEASTSLAGSLARFAFAFVALAWPFGIDHVLLAGRRLEDGAPVREVVHP